MGLGDRQRAEAAFVKGLDVDPHYFWGWVEMAVLQASTDAPPATRRQKTEPYLQVLRRDFAGHEAFDRCVERIERKLGQSKSP